jgi:hypothetical protein
MISPGKEARSAPADIINIYRRIQALLPYLDNPDEKSLHFSEVIHRRGLNGQSGRFPPFALKSFWVGFGIYRDRTIIWSGKIAMGGRFGKYGDLKRKAALRKSRKGKRLHKEHILKSPKRRKAEKAVPKK